MLHVLIAFCVCIAVGESILLGSGSKLFYILLTIFLPIFGAAVAYDKANIPSVKGRKAYSQVDNPCTYEYHNSDGGGDSGGGSD